MQERTLTEIVLRSLERHDRPDRFAHRRDGRWHAVGAAAMAERLGRLAGALAGSGIGPGDRVAIVSPTRLEWALSDWAVGRAGAVVVPVYPTLTAAQMAHILGHSGARLALVAGRDEWRKLESVRAELPALERLVSFEPIADPGAPPTLAELEAAGGTAPARLPEPDDPATIIYTSGTTGDPKGVLLTHANVVANVRACYQACPFGAEDLHLSFLPLSHIFERMVSYYMLQSGTSVWYAPDMARLKEYLPEARPTVLTAVPRVFEKLMAAIEEQGGSGSRLRRFILRQSVSAAREWTRRRWGGGRVPIGLALRHALADRLVYARLRAMLGGRVRAVITGGSATPAVVTEFFNGAGVPLLPGYGLTEFSPVIAFNTPTCRRLGTVGKPIPETEVRIAPDGEILARGPSLMRGYYCNPEATGATIGPGGWLHTGDIGQLDDDGYLSITDRKKDLIATAGGKKVAPQGIEEALCRDPFIAQAVLVGEGQPYIGALLVPRWKALEDWARSHGKDPASRPGLLADPEVIGLYRQRIELACRDRARFEAVKRFGFLERELSEEAGELTPTLKVKRRVVAERYRAEIAALYSTGREAD